MFTQTWKEVRDFDSAPGGTKVEIVNTSVSRALHVVAVN